MGRIISFSGRIGAGKSVLAKICEENGFEKLYFAMPLKKLVADLIHVNADEINDLKNVDKEYSFNKLDYLFISKETHIPFNIV